MENLNIWSFRHAELTDAKNAVPNAGFQLNKHLVIDVVVGDSFDHSLMVDSACARRKASIFASNAIWRSL